jgi:microcystin-dependent protein
MLVGAVIPFTGQTLPDHFLECDGTVYSIADYPELFDAIGNTYGGDGVTTFAVPNMSGRCSIGPATGHALGTTGGAETVALAATELPAHDHNVPAHGHSNTIEFETPTLTHTVTQPAFNYSNPGTTNNKYSAIATGAQGVRNSKSTAAMSRSTNFAVGNHAAAACTMSGGVTDCPAFDTESAGQGQAHNNMMPFLALAYIIQAEPDTPPVPSMALIHNGTVIPVTAGGAYIAGRK